MRFYYRTLDGRDRMLDADAVTFEPCHVAFWRDGRLVLAEQNRNVHRLRQV